MTLTALRGRLYLFGGSGTSAKCFQDLQIFDRHEMAWLDVVSSSEQNPANINHNTNSASLNLGNNVLHISGGRGYDPYNNRFRFGGNRMYDSRHSSLMEDPVENTLLLGERSTSNTDIEARPQQGGAQEHDDNSSSLYGDSVVHDDFWRTTREPLLSNRQHSINNIVRGAVAGPYSSPNPNDEDSVPCVLVHGHGPGRRAGHTATAVNRKIYIFGGSCGSDYLNDFFILDTDPPPSAVVTEVNPLTLMEQRLRHFFNDPEFADVVFVVGESKDKVYGHKMVLSIVSDCFRAMFTNGFKESEATEICIPDCSHSVFLAVMEYIYTGKLPTLNILVPFTDSCTVNNSNQSSQYTSHHPLQHKQTTEATQPRQVVHTQNLTRIVEMLELADRFFLDHLKQICESMLQSAVQGDTVEYLLSVAQKTNSSQLQSICLHYCRNNYRQIAGSRTSAHPFTSPTPPYFDEQAS